jgi:chorismate mutase/prephenate dehydratase
VEFLNGLMATSRHYQRSRLEGMRVAYSGVKGAFAWIAARKVFPMGEAVAYPDFGAAYDAVLTGECDVGILPIENSTAGEVGAVIDRLFSGSLAVDAVYDFSVTHHLMAPRGATLADIQRVISHPQALAQCADYLRRGKYHTKPFENTALAARHVLEAGDRTQAAIASDETAELYGLEIIAKNINEENINMTRFAVLTRAVNESPAEKGRHSIIMFNVSDDAGSLCKAIDVISSYGYNMRCLRSRPMKGLMWQYYFYVEIEGNLSTPHGKEMLEKLRHSCDKLKMLGSFTYPAELK